MRKVETPADLLDAAADLIDAAGWCQGRYETREGRHCAAGAMHHVAAVQHIDLFTQRGPGFAIDLIQREIGGEVTLWNDAAGQTEEEVVKTMRYVAERWRCGSI